MPGSIEPLSNLTLIKRYDGFLSGGTFSSSAGSTSSASAIDGLQADIGLSRLDTG